MEIKKDGDRYLVCASDFKNLEESYDYFFIDSAECLEFFKRIQAVLDFRLQNYEGVDSGNLERIIEDLDVTWSC
jgi:hypothetical protein